MDHESRPPDVVDVTALVHLYGGERTVNGQEGDVAVPVSRGGRARVRVINSDNGRCRHGSPAQRRVVAVYGTDLVGPTEVRDRSVLVTAGGRADVDVRMPADGTPVRVRLISRISSRDCASTKKRRAKHPKSSHWRLSNTLSTRPSVR